MNDANRDVVRDVLLESGYTLEQVKELLALIYKLWDEAYEAGREDFLESLDDDA